MTPNSWLPIAVSILLAASGYLFTYFHKNSVDRRAARLERVNRQLRELYGPLYAQLKAGQAVWDAFAAAYWPSHGQPGYFAAGYVTTDAEKATWRLWMGEVFGPMNERIEKTILANLDLLEESGFPEVYVKAIAHVEGYRVLTRRWANNDFAEHTSLCLSPAAELIALVEPAYHRLRQDQARLLRVGHRPV